jgi:hypothetical protein
MQLQLAFMPRSNVHYHNPASRRSSSGPDPCHVHYHDLPSKPEAAIEILGEGDASAAQHDSDIIDTEPYFY